MERLESQPDHEGPGDRDRSPEPRRSLDEGAEAKRHQQDLKPPVRGDPRHRLLHDLELAGVHRDVVQVDGGEDDPGNLHDAERHAVEETHAASATGIPKTATAIRTAVPAPAMAHQCGFTRSPASKPNSTRMGNAAMRVDRIQLCNGS